MFITYNTTIDTRTDKTEPHETSTVYYYSDLDGVIYHYPDMLDEDNNPDLELVAKVNVIHERITQNDSDKLFKEIIKIANKVFEDNVILINNFSSIWEA